MQYTTQTPLLHSLLNMISNPAPSGKIKLGEVGNTLGHDAKELLGKVAQQFPNIVENRGTNRLSYYWHGDANAVEFIKSNFNASQPLAPTHTDVQVNESSDLAPLATSTAPVEVMQLTTRGVASVSSEEVFIPEMDSTFVPWGEFSKIKKIIESKMFFPLYISGMSGNGKTMMVEQACARMKREYVRVQIGPETDEDDLLGGFRLINGETVFQKGPVVKAMESGAILLIDELDRGTNKIMCLQGVLEGKPILLKKIGEMIHPAPGFNVMATANTNGRGSDDGRYSAAQIIDDAFIERFVATIDQPYASITTEKKIVQKHMDQLDLDDPQFVENLVGWSTVIRKTFEAEGVDEVISTRRLCHIVKAFGIFGQRLPAIQMCINRFEPETREAFMDLYTKIDSGELKAESDVTELTPEEHGDLDAYTAI